MIKTERVFKFACREFIYGGHLLALGASGIAFTSAVLLNVKVTWDILLVSYLIVYAVYSYNRFKEFKKDFLTNLFRSQHIEKYIRYVPVAIAIYLLITVLLLLLFGNVKSIFLVFLMILLGFLYTDYYKKYTQKIIGLKSFYVSFIWSLLVFFTAFYYKIPINLSVFFIFIFILLRFILSTVFFDIKDIESDKKEKFKTIPVIFGKEKTLFILHVVNIISFVPIVVGVYQNKFPLVSLMLLIFYFYSMYYLFAAKNININIQKLSYVVVDGEYILWLMVLFIGNFILNVW